jgi:heterodisulfide reductase subunit A-like polyferredoxin
VKVSLKKKQGYLIAKDTVTNEQLLKAITKAGSYKGKVVERKPAN